MPTPYPDPFSGLTEGLQQGFQMGLLRRQQEITENQKVLDDKQKERQLRIQEEQNKRLMEAHKWEQTTGAVKFHIDFAKTIKNPVARQNYLNKAFTSKQFAGDENVSSLVEAMSSLPPEQQDDLGKWTGDVNKAIKERRFDDLPTYLYQLEAKAEENGWNIDKFLEYGYQTLGEERKKLSQPDDAATASLREFETVSGIKPETRGTPQYKKTYEDWLKVKNPGAGSGQIVVMPTAEGFAAINKRTGTSTPIIGSDGESVNKPLTGEMITTQQQIGTVNDTFNRVKELYKPEFVGPVQGRTGAVRSATIGNPEDRATFYAALQDINNTLVYLKSGKQINEQEYERLKDAMPHRNLADSDFRARMIEFEKVFNSIITERQKNMGGYGQAQPFPQRRATDKGGVRRYNPTTGRIE